MKTVQNLSDQKLEIPGVGVVSPGATAKVPDDFHNANFIEVKAGETKTDDNDEEEGDEPKGGKKGNKK